ncbi:hypothetical protein B4966_00655 [Rhodocyclaceae bacterium]|nr:hypothetical protein B4966_00655 [Rhodocyclaceae bacterium]
MIRVLLLLLIVVLLSYALWQVLQALRERRRARAAQPAQPGVDADRVAQADEEDEVDESLFNYAPRPLPDAAAAASAADPQVFQQTLELQQLRTELTRLQAQQLAQQAEMAALKDALNALREQFEANLAGQGVSPEYNEALVLARRGLEAEAIAERCGISVAEAELVRALNRAGGSAQEERA